MQKAPTFAGSGRGHGRHLYPQLSKIKNKKNYSILIGIKYKEHLDYNQIQVAKISWSTKKKMSHKAGHLNHKLWRRNEIFDAEEEMKYSMQYSTCWKLEIQLSWQNEKIRSTVLIYVAKLLKMTNTSPQG